MHDRNQNSTRYGEQGVENMSSFSRISAWQVRLMVLFGINVLLQLSRSIRCSCNIYLEPRCVYELKCQMRCLDLMFQIPLLFDAYMLTPPL